MLGVGVDRSGKGKTKEEDREGIHDRTPEVR